MLRKSQGIVITNRSCHFWGCGFALSACTTNLLLPLSTPSNDLGENISDIIGGREHLSFWHTIAWHQQFKIHGDSRRLLASISGSESCASPDRGSHLHLAAKSFHDLSTGRTMNHEP
jgi:hypothetical protein